MTTMRIFTRMGPSLLLALGLSVLLGGCSKPVAPVQAPAAQPAVQPAGVDTPEEILALEPDDKTGDLFTEYVHQLKAGDLIQASANLATLKGQLRGEDLTDPFWAERLPVEHRVTLLVGALCTTCTDGTCQTCKGRRACQVCSGSGLCKTCQGRGGDWIACQQCICKACSGARICPECKGRRTTICTVCNGSGNGKDEQKFESCPSCGGRGYKDGLRGPNNAQNRVKCLRCNGTKGTYITIRTTCAACDGTGRKSCGVCHGTGACPTCRGLGRTAECSLCGGQGRYLDPCEVCHGKKVCPECSGSKLCQDCKGQGVCQDCLGKNLVIRYRMPIDKRWLAAPLARVLRPGQDSPVQETVTGTTAAFILNNRNVTADVPEGSLLWASEPQDLRRISGLFLP
jgi:hypothetical protein